jgi:hypothetical protein
MIGCVWSGGFPLVSARIACVIYVPSCLQPVPLVMRTTRSQPLVATLPGPGLVRPQGFAFLALLQMILSPVDAPAGEGTSFSLVKQGYHGTVHISAEGFYVYFPPVTRLINAATLSDYFVYQAVYPGGRTVVNAIFVDIVGVPGIVGGWLGKWNCGRLAGEMTLCMDFLWSVTPISLKCYFTFYGHNGPTLSLSSVGDGPCVVV